MPGIFQIKDDLVVHGVGQEHDARLEGTLKRLQDYGLTLRKEKCHIGKGEVILFGHVFKKDGMSPDPGLESTSTGMRSAECRNSFRRLRDLLAANSVLVNYDPNKKTRQYVDHGPEVASTIAQA